MSAQTKDQPMDFTQIKLEDLSAEDRLCLALTQEQWFAPPVTPGVSPRWIDSLIASRLNDVFSFRYFNVPFMTLDVKDRNRIRYRVEEFLEDMNMALDEPMERVQ